MLDDFAVPLDAISASKAHSPHFPLRREFKPFTSPLRPPRCVRSRSRSPAHHSSPRGFAMTSAGRGHSQGIPHVAERRSSPSHDEFASIGAWLLTKTRPRICYRPHSPDTARRMREIRQKNGFPPEGETIILSSDDEIIADGRLPENRPRSHTKREDDPPPFLQGPNRIALSRPIRYDHAGGSRYGRYSRGSDRSRSRSPARRR